MPRMKPAKRMELEAFWRAHVDGWRQSSLNQREYCEAHGLPLKRFGNWRAKFRHDDPPKTGRLLYRRGGGPEHMLKHMRREIPPEPATYIPSARSGDNGRRRNFSLADKKRMVKEACREGASISGVAKKYGIGRRLLFHWKQELEMATQPEPTFLPVTIADPLAGAPADAPDPSIVIPQSMSAPAPVIVERLAPGIEVDLIGGRRVRFERDADPEAVRRLVALLEGEAP